MQDHALPDQEARERDDERRDADLGDDRALAEADHGGEGDREGDGDDARIVVRATGQLELGDRKRGDAAEVADREVDLAEQEDEDDAVGEHR